MLAFCKKNPQEGCRSSGNPAVFFSLNGPFHGGAAVPQWISGHHMWGCRYMSSGCWEPLQLLHHTKPGLSQTAVFMFFHFPMLLIPRKDGYGEQISAGLTKSSHDYTDAKRNIQWSLKVWAGDLSAIRPALDSILICLFASFWQLT